ncbi:MAG: FHA domain-containing protein, partial [Terracidiphilus sp.]
MAQNSNFPKNEWIVGRDPDCDLIVAEPPVSGRHCKLTRQGDHYTIEDLGSKNGTFVNGMKLMPGQPAPLPRGATVTLGAQVRMPMPPEG